VTTWAQLRADVVALTNRTDIDDKISRFVAIFEDRLRRNLRVSQMEQSFSGTIDGSNEIAKPAGWLAFRAVWPGAYPAQQLLAQSLDSVVSKDKASGVPTMYAVKADAFLFDGSGDVSGVYYQDIPGIEANGSNWLSVSAFDAYIFGTLSEAWDYVGNDAQAQRYLQRSATVIDSIAASDQRDRHNGPLAARKR
jgi:hypothetical protein